MKKKLKVGFIAFHPGATNTLTKIINQLRNEGHEVVCYPFLNYARDKWNVLDENIYEDSPGFFNDLPTDFDAILYSSAADSYVENYLPLFCKKHNICCISTIDVFWINEKELERRFKTKPDILITPEKSVFDMIKKLGWNVEVYNYGNPHLEINEEQHKEIDFNNKTINYISFPNGNEILCDTDDVSKKIMIELLDIVNVDNRIKHLFISLHPRENDSFIKVLLNNHPELKNRVSINPYINTTECCKHSDVIVGYTSTVLYEELIKGKAVVFYENKEQLIKILCSDSDIKNEINFEIPKNSVENIIQLIKNKQ